MDVLGPNGEDEGAKKRRPTVLLELSDRLRLLAIYVETPWSLDGAGGRTMRYLATWAFAEEVGCDCHLPKGYRSGSSADGVLCCHESKYIKKEDSRCATVDWKAFFNMSAHLKAFPDDGQPTKTIEVSAQIERAMLTVVLTKMISIPFVPNHV